MIADTAKRAGLAQLERLFPDRFETGDAVRRQHANTLSSIQNQPPDAVVWAETTRDVVRIIEVAAEYGLAVIPFGAGTSLEGHVNAPSGGVSIDMSRMKAILRFNPDDLDCQVEAGATLGQLNNYLRETGLFFSVDPGAEHATLGGMASTRASGTNTVRFGTMSDNVLSLTVVLADGRVVETGNRARKSAAGFDLTRLLIGSEGTLGVITALTLRLHPRPEMIGATVVSFDTLEAACHAAISSTQINAGLARVELVDGLTIAAVNRYSSLSLPVAPTLFIEWHAMASCTAQCFDALRAVLTNHGAASFESAQSEEARNKLWKARHEAFWAIRSAWPGRTPVVTDACVPVSQLASCIVQTEKDIRECGLIAPVAGHVGDGNFHTIIMTDPSDAAEAVNVQRFVERLSDRAASMGGTCSGEHGIGQGKIEALARQAGGAVGVMHQIKKALDPKGILNPGKIFGV